MTPKDLSVIIIKMRTLESYNKFIFFLQKIPIIGKTIPNRWYKVNSINRLLIGLQFIILPIKKLMTSSIYVIICSILSMLVCKYLTVLNHNSLKGFPLTLTIMIVFSLLLATGGYCELIDCNDMKQVYLIKFFHVSPKVYYRTHELLKAINEIFFKSIVFGILFMINHFSFWHSIMFALLLTGSRLAIKMFSLYLYDSLKKVSSKAFFMKIFVISSIIGVLLALLILKIGDIFSPMLFFSWYAGIIGLLLWLISYYTLSFYPNLNLLTRQLLTHETIKENADIAHNFQTISVQIKNTDIDFSEKNKNRFDHLTGIDYLNAIFMNRMRKYLHKKIKIRLCVIVTAWFIAIVAILFFKQRLNISINDYSFARFVFVSIILGYWVYIGESYMQFCFYHLDRPLLIFNEYRKREIILKNLNNRFFFSIQLNVPILITSILFYITCYIGLFDIKIHQLTILIAAQIISMLFFSLYFLYLYFLLQPFTEGLKSKSKAYSVLTFIFYFGWYKLFRLISIMNIPILIISSIIIVCLMIIGYCAVLKFAPKTFKLKK